MTAMDFEKTTTEFIVFTILTPKASNELASTPSLIDPLKVMMMSLRVMSGGLV